ncbi:uncharacterized protein BX664DRAFT_384365 [Halteromyces radiatus]|uniref:uncharacterized protein n=1 Tax=Halteromyces radiatus TaxID=101107 RepID=UPI00221F0D28|nr:uncharacterized protein BX664DRAFT_384365 [Halteromyces radiatus]KAI8092850.1 hypothetical protein BX664DRAFT_384365 [Halteromyces radiatus]
MLHHIYFRSLFYLRLFIVFFFSFFNSFLQKMTSFLNLPDELMGEINRYLSSSDRCQLRLVNKSLNEIFKQFLFTSISLRMHVQASELFRAMSMEPELFRKTNNLNIQYLPQGQLSLTKALRYCPNLTMLKICNSHWISHHCDGYPMLPQLSQLEINCSRTQLIENLGPFFSKCPNLKSLKLWKLSRYVPPLEAESLHNMFPRLQELCLDYIRSGPNLFQLMQPIPIPDEPCAFMKKITFTVDPYHNSMVWLTYIAQKYPNIEILDVTEDENDGFAAITRVEDIQSAVHQLFNSCSNLSSLRLVNVWWTDIFLDYYMDPARHLSSSIKEVEIVDTRGGVSPYLFTHLCCSVMTFIKVLDVTLSPQIIDHPKLFSYDLSSGIMLTDLKISIGQDGRSSSNILSIHWILESCPSLVSLTLDSSFLGVVDSTSNGWASRTKHDHLKRLIITNCIFKDEIWSYIEKKCPKLDWLSLEKSILQDDSPYPSIQLDFPNHVFKSIIINQVRCPRMVTSVRPWPFFGSPIYFKPMWDEGWIPIEFMTIQRRQHPTLSTDNSGSAQRNIVRLTFQALNMDFIDQRRYYRSYGEMSTSDLFRHLERLLEIKCLTDQEVWYHIRECKIPIPSPSSNNYSSSSSSSSSLIRKRKERLRHAPETDRGGYVMINVDAVDDIVINQKWIVMQGEQKVWK